ncbi:MAG TPA: 50S ribosomal protein L1 [Firmicutes bacterium]|nr:50S ribosomal protein L1 [Bacillota bacterium]
MARKISKRLKSARELVESEKLYTLDESIELVGKFPPAKFDETVELHIRLGVDPKHADQMVRGTVVLPHGTGKDVRVLVFASGDQEKEALEAGADYVGGDDLVEKVKGGWLDFDIAISTPDMMKEVGKLGRVLGPRGLMPNPKVGTVTADVKTAVSESKAGRVEYKVDKFGIVHVPVGKRSFNAEQLRGNLSSIIKAVIKAKPSSAKGTYLRSAYVTTTMGPSVKLDIATLQSV